MAFGVIDKVIALPSGFMTSRDRQSRDLAIAHELEHHRGHDLLAIPRLPVMASDAFFVFKKKMTGGLGLLRHVH